MLDHSAKQISNTLELRDKVRKTQRKKWFDYKKINIYQ